MSGKNFSRNNRGQRRKSDFYETPYSMTRHLFEVEEFGRDKICLEPACGNLAMVKVLFEYIDDVRFYDIEKDFLTENREYDYVITNPPYSLAFEFVLKAKRVCSKFAFLLPLSYLHGKKRFDKIYNDRKFPLKSVNVFTRYPLLGDPLREDGKYRTGMMVYAWYVWEKGYEGEPVIRWIDNHEDVIKKGK